MAPILTEISGFGYLPSDPQIQSERIGAFLMTRNSKVVSNRYCFNNLERTKIMSDNENNVMTPEEKAAIQARHRMEQAENRDRARENKAKVKRHIDMGRILEKAFPASQYMTMEELEDYLTELFKLAS